MTGASAGNREANVAGWVQNGQKADGRKRRRSRSVLRAARMAAC
ncbi:hypothetical protein BH24ACT18_BH24ACT18_00900 [soil metagenome]